MSFWKIENQSKNIEQRARKKRMINARTFMFGYAISCVCVCVHRKNGIGIDNRYKQSAESIQNMNLFNGTERNQNV